MSRITIIELEAVAEVLSDTFNRQFAITRYNGFYHLEMKKSHENICTGTAREVMDAMYYMRIAYYMIDTNRKVGI